jgi:hypothetical protein
VIFTREGSQWLVAYPRRAAPDQGLMLTIEATLGYRAAKRSTEMTS